MGIRWQTGAAHGGNNVLEVRLSMFAPVLACRRWQSGLVASLLPRSSNKWRGGQEKFVSLGPGDLLL